MPVISFLPWLITAAGGYFLFKLRFFFILHPKKTFAAVKTGGRGDFVSLSLALAGTLGVGNIVGVSLGISIGGAGAVFWLLLSSLFSSVIKYAEVALSASAEKSGRGFIGIVKESFGRFGAPLATLFALLCLVLSLTMGSALQCSAAAECAQAALKIKREYLLLPILILVAAVTSGGEKFIEKAVSIIIPLTTLVYVFMCFSVILPNFSRFPAVLSKIFSGAFSLRSAGGGMLGFISSKAISEGYARGILSNEAGAGTSSFAHIRGDGRNPHEAGVFGILEVVFDTAVLCSVTAFAILLSPAHEAGGDFGSMLIAEAFRSVLGDFSVIALFISVLLFALATVFCWYYYGTVAGEYIFGKKFSRFYFFLFLLASGLGIFIDGERLIYFTDIILFALSLITLSTLVKNRKKVYLILPLEFKKKA